jgi:hypothetical protein
VELSIFSIIAMAAGSVVVIGWLIVSFTPPSQSRTIIEWLSTTAMYAVILTIFVSLVLRLHASGHVFGAWALGALCVLFGGGLLVSAWKAVVAIGGEKKVEDSATN